MKFDEIIDELEKSNPYPSDVFTEPSDKDWKRAWKLLEKNGIIPDRIAAKWGRMTWQNCINKMKELEMETTEQKAKNLPDDADIIPFGMWLTGHDKETVEQLYRDAKKWNH